MSTMEETKTGTARGRVVPRKVGERYVIPDNRIELKGYGVFEFDSVAGTSIPAHVHEKDDELHYVLEGMSVYTIGEDTFEAPAGSLIYLPRQVVHAVTFGEAGARWLWITDPANEGIARELGIPADDTTPLPTEEEWDWEKTFEVFGRYGMEFVEPEG